MSCMVEHSYPSVWNHHNTWMRGAGKAETGQGNSVQWQDKKRWEKQVHIKFYLNVKKHFFTMRSMEHSFPTEIVDSPPWAPSKAMWIWYWATWWKWPGLSRGLDQMNPEILSNLSHPVTVNRKLWTDLKCEDKEKRWCAGLTQKAAMHHTDICSLPWPPWDGEENQGKKKKKKVEIVVWGKKSYLLRQKNKRKIVIAIIYIYVYPH